MIQMITGTENFDKALEKGDMIAGFSAPWCGRLLPGGGYGRRLQPMIVKLSEEIDIPIYGVNIDEDEALAERYHIETIPDIVYFKDGKPVDSIIGYGNVGYPELKAFVEKNRG